MEGKTALLPGEAWGEEGGSPNPRRKAWLNPQESAEAVVPAKASKARIVRHRRTKGAGTDRPSLNPWSREGPNIRTGK